MLILFAWETNDGTVQVVSGCYLNSHSCLLSVLVENVLAVLGLRKNSMHTCCIVLFCYFYSPLLLIDNEESMLSLLRADGLDLWT